MAFELRTPLHELRAMPARDLQLYQLYIARRGLPSRRLELLLAQVSYMLARVNGEGDVQMSDFLFDPAPPDVPPAQRDLSDFL